MSMQPCYPAPLCPSSPTSLLITAGFWKPVTDGESWAAQAHRQGTLLTVSQSASTLALRVHGEIICGHGVAFESQRGQGRATTVWFSSC